MRSMRSEVQKYRGLNRFLEVISKDAVDMAFFWKMNSINFDVGVAGTSLTDQLDFVNKTLFHCELTNEGLVPVEHEGKVEDVSWEFALLYDTCYEKDLIKRDNSEDDYDVSEAFFEGRFMGWKVKFFDTLEGVEQFIATHSGYTPFHLYHKLTKVSFKYGYFDGPCRVYTTITGFCEHEDRFIECKDLYKFTYEGRSKYAICPTREDILDAAVSLIRPPCEMETAFTDFTIEDRHSRKMATLFSDCRSPIDMDFVVEPCWKKCKLFEQLVNGEEFSLKNSCSKPFFECPMSRFIEGGESGAVEID